MSTATAIGASAAPRRAVHRASPLTVGVVVFLASECMFFSGLFAAYFTLRGIALEWPVNNFEFEVATITRASIFTFLLVVSSFTMQMGVRALAAGRVSAFRNWVFATMALGTAFVANQAVEWSELMHEGHTPAADAFFSAFFTMTGFHGFHVSGGILAMAVLVARSGAKRFGKADLPSVEVVSYYWHFVDVVWVLMFAILFFVQ